MLMVSTNSRKAWEEITGESWPIHIEETETYKELAIDVTSAEAGDEALRRAMEILDKQ
jgi:hypothetical protein